MIWFRSANSHTGPQLHRCIRGRTDGSIRLRANLLQKPLALGGASTDEYTAQMSSGPNAHYLRSRRAKGFAKIATSTSLPVELELMTLIFIVSFFGE